MKSRGMSQRSAVCVMRELASGRFVTINMKRRCTASLTARGDGGEERVAPEERGAGMLIEHLQWNLDLC